MREWYHFEGIEQLDSPALVIYADRVRENIQTLTSMVDEVYRLRPHVKTHKSPDVTKLLLEAGINKFKCATIAEAEMLAQAGAKDILLAYQPIGPKINRFIALIQKYSGIQFSCLVDNIQAAEALNQAAVAKHIKLSVFIDLNVGMNRTGIEPGLQALHLYESCNQLSNLTPHGLHAYDGHIRNSVFEERKRICDQQFALVETTRDLLIDEGNHKPEIIAGGSPSFSIHSKRKEVQCSPGTFIYWDAGYLDLCKEQNFLPAALVITRVISLPSPTTICTDLGHKSIAAENEITRRVQLLNAPNLRAVSQSEEHLVLEAGFGHGFLPGDILYGLPFHICPTCALYERAHVVENRKVSGEWKTVARDRKLTV